MDHLILNNGSDSAALAEVALKALREARNSKTSNSGSIFVSDGRTDDDGIALGTGTIINGVDGGIQPWVGDTTPPGKPTGLSVSSKNAAVFVNWDGSMEGGEPLDWGHLQLLAKDDKGNNYDFGVLYGAGSQQLADLTPGVKLTVWAVGYDDAHDAQGKSTPNASTPSDKLTVTVESAVDPKDVQKAQSDAQSALNQAGQAKSTADTASQTAQGAQTDAKNAVTTANSANDTSTHAFSTAQSALTAAQSAQQDTVTQWVPQYAVNQSTTDAPATGWSVEKPSWTAGHYIWLRTVVGYGSGDYTYSNPVLLTGNTGPQGQKGDPGAPGPAGVDGKDGTSVNIKGSVASASQLPSSAVVGDGYLTDDTGHLYVWGDSGWTDVGAIRGPNGASAYVHTAWSNSLDGKTDFSLTDGGTRTYMGVYADNVAADSTTPGDYTWTRIVGPQGPHGTNGFNGVSVTAITPYWALGTSAPAQPAVSAPPSPWQSTEPGYSRNQHLYKTSKVTYDNGQFAYMPVVMDSSYEYSAAAESSARDAVQTATNANTTAQTAKSTADSAASTASTAKSTADSASSVATQANATAVSANQSATSAQTAANLALANAQEFVVNGGFETGALTGWTASGVAVLGLDQDYPHSGNYQARFSAGASCSQSIKGLVSGHVIRCSFWQRGYDSRTATMTISFNGGDEQTVGSITGVTPYTRAFKDFTVPANTTTATIKLTCDTNYIWFDDISVKDITEAQAAQKAADDAQSTADTANTTAKNAAAIANAAKAAAQGAQTTADGKNKIFSSASEPSHTGIVPGDMWFQLDSNKNVNGIQVWNGSAFTDMVLLGNKLLVASSVGTTQIADNAIVTGKIAANAITAIKIAAQTITGDKLDVGSVAAAIVTSGKFQTSSSGARVEMDSSGITGYNSAGTTTFKIDAITGDVSMIGKFYSGDKSVSRVIIDDDYNKISSPGYVDVDGYVAFESHLSAESPIIGGMHSTLRGTQDKVSGAILTSGIANSSKPAGANIQLNSYEDGNASEGSLMATMHKMDAYHNIAVVDVNSSEDGQVALLRSDGSDKGNYASVESRVPTSGDAYVAIVSKGIFQVDPVTGSMDPIHPSSMVVTQASRDYQSNLGTALTQIQFTTLSGSGLYSLSSGGVKVPYDGLYLITGSGYYNKQQAGQGRNTFVYKNNAQVAASPGFSLNSANYSIGYSLCAPVRCAAGDIIYVKTNGGLAAHQWYASNVITIARIAG